GERAGPAHQPSGCALPGVPSGQGTETRRGTCAPAGPRIPDRGPTARCPGGAARQRSAPQPRPRRHGPRLTMVRRKESRNMTRQDSESLWIALGPFGAMVLGVALIPLRGITPASTLAFAFLALTIVVAEIGGRRAGLSTAVVSALSLNFFLTAPYL